jgi:hypothetical protein
VAGVAQPQAMCLTYLAPAIRRNKLILIEASSRWVGCAVPPPTVINQRRTRLAAVSTRRDEGGSPMRFYTKKHRPDSGIDLHATICFFRKVSPFPTRMHMARRSLAEGG